MKFELIERPLKEIGADVELIFVVNKDLEHKFIKDKCEFEFYGFKGEGVLFLQSQKRLYVGIANTEVDTIRQGAAKAYNALKDYEVSSLKVASYITKCAKFSTQALVEGFILASYKFDKYKKEKKQSKLESVLISSESFDENTLEIEKAKIGITNGQIMANATNFAKDIVNEIPEVYTPLKFEQDALELAKSDKNIKCKVYDEKFLQKESMNAFLAVNRASVHPPRLIHLSYTPKDAKKRIVFVGKGLTYDSGGLSLKPADYMLTMKADKSGGAAVMAIIKAASELGLKLEIHSIIGATENMIGGNAYKPDDVLISRAGVSIEVRNTDAEGRLVLADCLSFAQDLKPDILIDLATLTGACVVGLGEYTTGVMGNSSELKESFRHKSKLSGELNSELEFNDYLKELIKSQIADVSNAASSRYGGAITAGLFLDKFIKDEYKDSWLHLDIAGPAYVEKPWGYNQAGASGAGVRACLYFLNSIGKDK
ncbi:leucyl aminopeptidase [Campylobacter sp. 19-13652]|uniref:leucyl aminopeptidase n=1 Tax=Campylobacter sp. 19-13652 TaxID=2840180 RepID=UPI001C77A7A6|nr:leucyl aminopeptidase [Campylobacter sp. 19-13652]BCX79099.1 putative cytosol aminopeptidase [Campylobacter sp. 19-13652]